MTQMSEHPSRGGSRARLTLVLASPAVLVALIAVVASLVFLSSLGIGEEGGTQAGLARIGNAVALLVVTDESGEATALAARSFILNWGVVAPVAALVPAFLAAWILAGRVLGTLDRGRAEVKVADDERQKRLQEVVHELRTPLAVMATNLELATAEAGEGHRASGYIDAALRASDRMARTVNDLEGYGQLSVEQAAGPSNLALLAEEAVAEHLGPGRARGIHLLVAGTTATVVTADPAAVRTAIGNFLSNAVRLAPRGSAIVVDWGGLDDWAWLAVSDEGPGLAPHLHGRAFERGWRGPHERNFDSGNTESGLGLTIARQLTEAQGGAVTLVSEEGGGATLTVWLPLAPEAAVEDVVAPDGIHPTVLPWRRDFQPA